MTLRSTGRRGRQRSNRLARAQLAAALSVGLFAACRGTGAAPDAPLPLPALEVAGDSYAGSPLRGVVPGAADALDLEPAHALVLEFELEYVERLALDGAPAISAQAQLIHARRGVEPIQASARLADEVRALEAGDARAQGRRRTCHAERVVLLPGTTQVYALKPPGSSEAPWVLALTRAGAADEAQLSVELSGAALAIAEDEDPPATVAWSELVVLDPPCRAGAPERWLAWRAPSPEAAQGGYLARLALRAPPQDPGELAQHVARAEAARSRALAAQRRQAERAARVERAEVRRRERENALESLAQAENRREALVFLAAATEALLCGDLALLIDDELVERLVEYLTGAAARSAELAHDQVALGWHLERSAWLAAALRMNSDLPLPPALRGTLVRHAGEVGRSAAAIEDLVRASRNLAEFQARLVAENRVYLEDTSPAARVRAFDWLAARGQAPAGFDPLADEEARRAALEASEAPAEAGGPPR